MYRQKGQIIKKKLENVPSVQKRKKIKEKLETIVGQNYNEKKQILFHPK